MSKAFTKDDGDEVPVAPPLPPLPPGPHYLTPEGAAALREEHRRLTFEERPALRKSEDPTARGRLAVLDQRVRDLAERLERLEVVHPPADRGVARIGAWVTVDGDAGERTVRIVGIDEVDAARGLVSWRSPLGAALLGAREGDEVVVRSPRGEETLTVTAVRYAEAPR